MLKIDPTRWAEIEAKPLPTGVGNLESGMCAFARIMYTATGQVTDLAKATCVSPVIRSLIIGMNDSMSSELRGRLGTLDIAERVLKADPSPEAEQRRAFMCADAAIRSAVRALRSAKLDDVANTLDATPKIDNAYAAADAAYAAYAAYAAADAARAADAAYAAARAAAYAAYAADAARAADAADAADAAADAAYAAYAAARAARVAAWEPMFELLDEVLAA